MAAGFGFVNNTVSNQFAFKVSDQLDYEISMWFMQPTRNPTFELSVDCFDCQFQTTLVPIDVQGGASQRVLIPGNLRICGAENQWNFLRMVVYSSNEPLHASIQPETSHAAGTNLIMQKGTAKMFVNLICVQNCLLVWNFCVKPLRTEFSTGFIQSRGLLEIWRKNNKQNMTAAQIDQLATQFLIPYDSAMVVTEI